MNRIHDLLPTFLQWRQEFQDPSLTLWDYVNAQTDAEVAGAVATLFWPTIIEHEGCFLLEERFSEQIFAEWRDRYQHDRAAIERMINHVHLVDVFVNTYDSGDLRVLEFIAQTMARCWQCALREHFPQQRFTVEYDRDAEGNGPSITFYQHPT